MIDRLVSAIGPDLPLSIREVQRTDESLWLRGDGWSFSTSSVWRVADSERVRFACYDREEVSSRVEEIKEQQIVEIRRQGTVLSVDPVFVMANGWILEVFSTDTFEPWTMHLPNGDVFVASPSDPSTLV